MHLRKTKRLAKRFLDKCEEIYGYSKYYDCSPYLEFEKSIYSRYAGDDNNWHECEEDDTPQAEYDGIENTIVIYYRNILDEKQLAETIIHEYQHYLQSPSWMTRYYNMGYNYQNHPYEVAATQAEKDVKKLLK